MANNNIPIYYKNGKVYDSNMTNVEKILHSKKLNYKDLKFISDPYFKDNKTETVNVYIDLYDVVKQFYSPLLIEEFRVIRSSNKMNIISEIINIVGHYRHFFVNRYGKYATIIFYYSSKEDPYFKKNLEDYKKDFYQKRLASNLNQEFYVVNKVLRDCIGIVKEYLHYIPHAYLIDTLDLEPSLFPYYMKFEMNDDKVRALVNPDDYTIILSSNKLALMNIIHYKDSGCILKAKWNEWKYIDESMIYSELGLDNPISMPNSMIPIIMSIAGYKSFNIPNVPKMKEKKAYNIVSSKYKNGQYKLEEICDPSYLEVVKKNYKIFNFKSYPFTQKINNDIVSQFIDISDFEYIRNETFNNFNATCMILLDYLFDGEEI